MSLAQLNAHPRDANITFRAEGHIYTVRDFRNTKFTSVTTLIHSLFAAFDSDKIITGMMASKKWPDSKYFGMTKQDIQKQWSDSGTAAANAGTALHADIEAHYNGLPVANDSLEYAHFMRFKADFARLVPYRTEWMIYHEELRLAGSIDMVFSDDGALLIYDWKRVAEISKVSKFNQWSTSDILMVPDSKYWHYALQLNIYKAILIEKYGMNITDLYLIGLHPTNPTYARISVCDLQSEVRQLFSHRLQTINAKTATETKTKKKANKDI